MPESRTIVIGAGPAGLAVGACLARQGIPCLILEQGAGVGAAWRGHYDRLCLHTDKAHSALPFVRWPRSAPRYPSRLQLIEYLEAYAAGFRLQTRFRQRVLAARRVGGGWEVQTADACHTGSQLVVASGYNREPCIPAWPGQASFRGPLLHSCAYRNGQPFRNLKVLVVGFGNSGGEIAIDLCEHGAQASLAVRGPVNVVPRDLFGIPIVAIAAAQERLPARVADALNALILRLAVGDLTRCGLHPHTYGPLTQIRREARIPLVDVGTLALIRRGAIALYPAVAEFTADEVAFSDGRHARFDAVILATGYRARVHEFLEGAAAAHDAAGTPYSSGRESQVPGRYFCGYRVTAAGMLREIAREARRIGSAIASD